MLRRCFRLRIAILSPKYRTPTHWHQTKEKGDPIGLAGGVNAYAYVNANPPIYVDHILFPPFQYSLGEGSSGPQ